MSEFRRRLSRAWAALFPRTTAKIDRFVFVFTYGRSGSTLLMGLLNSIPGYCIRGENNNAVYCLFEMHQRIAEARTGSLKNSERHGHPWFGLHLIDPEAMRQTQRQMVTEQILKPERHHRVTGFKEIRFSEKEVPDFDAYIAYIQNTFAPCKIVFNHRNLDNVAKSGWWKNMPEALARLQVMEDRFRSVPEDDCVFHFSYDALCADPGYASELMAFLGEPYDPKAVGDVLNVRHSY